MSAQCRFQAQAKGLLSKISLLFKIVKILASLWAGIWADYESSEVKKYLSNRSSSSVPTFLYYCTCFISFPLLMPNNVT